ncbi:MAG: hypothetical protein IKJ58_08365 [Akkermansia sp.]|nr:hypothetical protein [Akkermansia sp.]
MKNITRYTLEKTSFLGWRVCISRKGIMITKYFPDKLYDGEQGSLEAAIAMRDDILGRVSAEPANAKKIMQEMKSRYCAKKRKKRKS